MKSRFLALALLRPFVLAAPYIVTNYVELSIYTDAGYTESDYTQPPTTETETYLVTPATTSFSPLQTFTADTEYSDLTIIDVVLPTGVGNEISVDLSGLATSYVVPITYLPSATCSQNWTFTTQVPVYVPSQISLSAVSLSTSVTTDTYVYYDLKPTPTTNIIAILNPTDVDTGDLASASSYNEPYGLSYCYTPTTYCTTIAASSTCTPTFVYDSSSNYEGGYYGDDPYDSYYWQVILIAVLVPVSWILIWLMVGLWESWLSFKGVMLGLHRKRGLPYAWCCVSIFFLCCVGPTYKAKSAEEQAELLEKWNAMKKREKFKLWMKWGFRWKYPDMLGDEPEFAKRPPRQGCL
jgi:hypothetical protein